MADLSTDPEALDTAPGEAPDVLDSAEAGGRIIRGGVLRFAGYVGMVGLSVISAAVLTRYLGVVRFGEYTTAMSLVAVVASITDAGMSSMGTREFAVRRGADRDALMRDLLGLRVTLTMVGAALIAAFGLTAGYDTPLLVGAVLAALGTVALVVQHTFTIPLTTALRIGTLSSLDLARQVLTVAAIVALVALGAGMLPLLAVALAVNLLLVPPTAALARRQISLRVGLRPRRWSPLLRLTVSFSLATAVGTIYVFTAQILTSLVSSSHQSGLFAASFRIFIVMAAVPGLLVGSALPVLARAARDDRARLAYALGRMFHVSLIAGIAAALVCLAGARFMIAVVAGPHFGPAAGVLRIQGLSLIASFLLAGWGYALLSLRRHRGLLLANLVALLVSTALTLILASAEGARGAALATLCGETTLALGYLVALTRKQREHRPSPGIAIRVLLAAVPAAALAIIPGMSSVPRTLAVLVAYGLLIVVFRAVPPEAIELLPARLRRAS